jgi:hypothetical protein
MDVESIAGYCERCGQRFELVPPKPNARDIGLEKIKSVFRYCAHCHQFAGRTCCWNPEAVACIVCAPRTLAKPGVQSRAAARSIDQVARDALAELNAAVGALAEVADVVEPTRIPRDGHARAAWDEAWWAASWLVARAESSRDVVSKRLWSETNGTDPAFHQLAAEFQRVLGEYESRLRLVGTRLRHTGTRIAGRRGPRVARREALAERRRRSWRRPLAALAAALAVVALVGVGASTGTFERLLSSAVIGLSPEGPRQTPGSTAGGVLGGGPVVATPAPALSTLVEFDTLRMGGVVVADEIIAVEGRPEVVSFPSPFDRSVRLAGADPGGLCFDTGGLQDARTVVSVDLYPEAPLGNAAMAVALGAADTAPSQVSVSLRPLATEPIERWYRVTTTWVPDGMVEVELWDVAAERAVARDGLTKEQVTGTEPAGSVCLTVAEMATDSGVLLDNLRIEQ